jgi:hypothetical protein
MKIKKNTFSTLVLELFSPSIANCRKLKIQKNPKIDFPYCTSGRELNIRERRKSFKYPRSRHMCCVPTVREGPLLFLEMYWYTEHYLFRINKRATYCFPYVQATYCF